MRKFSRRLEALEEGVAQRHANERSIPDRALRALPLEALGLLITAHGADRQGRPLTQHEATARHGYGAALEAEYRSAGLRAPSEFEPMREIRWLIMLLVISKMPWNKRNLLVRASEATQQGRPFAEQESAAIELCDSLAEPLCLEAGFASVEEADFERYALQQEFSK